MDWFHCNKCFMRRGSKFALSSCGHICCEACIKSKQCSVCGANCNYLALNDEMKPQQRVFFKDPVELIQSRLAQMTQIAIFQQKQGERVITHFKNKASELEHLKDVTEQGYRREVSELKKENAELKKQLSELKREANELKKPLSQRRISPAQFQTHGTQRVSRPVAVTSPVTPHLRTAVMRHGGSGESQRWPRGSSLSFTTPGSISMPSISSHSSLHEHRTPSYVSTPRTPVFHFPSMNTPSVQLPRY